MERIDIPKFLKDLQKRGIKIDTDVSKKRPRFWIQTHDGTVLEFYVSQELYGNFYVRIIPEDYEKLKDCCIIYDKDSEFGGIHFLSTTGYWNLVTSECPDQMIEDKIKYALEFIVEFANLCKKEL